MSVTSVFSKHELTELLKNDKAFRDTFVLEFIRNSIPNQLRAIRQERGWKQEDLGKAAGKPRNVITRLENPNSHIPNLASLYEIAIGCGTGLLVKFVPISRLLKEIDAPFSADYAPSIDSASEAEALDEWEVSFPSHWGENDDEGPAPVTGRTQLVSVGGNPRKSANQRTLKLVDLKLVASNKPVPQPTNLHVSQNTEVRNLRLVGG